MKTVLIYAAVWLGMVVLAILNGGLREKFYGPHMAELSAHQLSTVLFLALIGVWTYAAAALFPLHSAKQAWLVGGMWLGMTVAFEFWFGHYVMGHAWSTLLHDYNLAQGRVWVLVLIWTFLAPYTVYRLQS